MIKENPTVIKGYYESKKRSKQRQSIQEWT